MRKKSAVKIIFGVFSISGLLLLAGCEVAESGPSSNPTSQGGTVSVNVSPKSGSVQVGMSFQFVATVQGDSANKGVTWSISAASGCDCGRFDSTGKYYAPNTAHYAPGLLVTATSVSDTTKSDTAVVFVTPAPTGIGVSPSVASLPLNGMQQFSASGTPFGAVPVVNWTISGDGCAVSSCGTIDSNGRYTAPAIAPNPSALMVTATSSVDSTVLGSAAVTVEDGTDNAKLSGQYAFLLRGYNGDGNAALAGSFIADGKGNITNGVGDYVFSSGLEAVAALTFTGTYSVSSDNRGSITITPANSQGHPIFTQVFSFSLGSFSDGVANRGQLVELDNTDISATGALAKQDPTAFSTAVIVGDFAFGFQGTASSGFPMTTAGRFTTSGGSLTTGYADVYGLGLAENGSGMVTSALDVPFTGIYEVSSNGRGTATLNGLAFSNFSFYVISSSELWFIELDGCLNTALHAICSDKSGISGSALRQSGGPFSISSLKGMSVFNLTSSGTSGASGGAVAIGEDAFDGNGNVLETRDENNNGAIANGSTVSGTYSVDTNGLGRGLITWPANSQPKPFYMVGPGKAFLMDSGSYEAGMFEPQTGGPSTNASIVGNYAVGTLPWNFNWVFDPASGVLTADGIGNLMGTTDSRGGTGESFAGSYSATTNGRTTITVGSGSGSSSNWVFYLTSPSKAVGIEVTPGTTNSAIRVIEK